MFPSNGKQTTESGARKSNLIPRAFGNEVGRSRSRREGKEGKELEGRGELLIALYGCYGM